MIGRERDELEAKGLNPNYALLHKGVKTKLGTGVVTQVMDDWVFVALDVPRIKDEGVTKKGQSRQRTLGRKFLPSHVEPI